MSTSNISSELDSIPCLYLSCCKLTQSFGEQVILPFDPHTHWRQDPSSCGNTSPSVYSVPEKENIFFYLFEYEEVA